MNLSEKFSVRFCQSSRCLVFLLTLFVLLFLGTLYLHDLLYKPTTRHQQFQNAFYESYKLNHDYLKHIVAEYDNWSGENMVSSDYLVEQLPLYATLFIQDSDSLVYWSGNTIDINNEQLMMLQHQAVVSLKNGLYYCHKVVHDTLTFTLLNLVYAAYPFENDFISNGFTSVFPEGFTLNQSGLSEENRFDILTTDGEVLFSISLQESHTFNEFFVAVLSIFLTIILLILFQWVYWVFELRVRRFFVKHWFLLFVVSVILIRGLLLAINFPQLLFGSDFFSSAYLSAGILVPSLGDLWIHAVTLLFLAFRIYRYYEEESIIFRKQYGFISYTLRASQVFMSSILYLYLIDIIILNSSIPLSFRELYSFNLFSYLSFLIIAVLSVSLMVFVSPLVYSLGQGRTGRKLALVTVVFFAILLAGITYSTDIKIDIHYFLLLVFLWLLTLINQSKDYLRRLSISIALFLSILLTFIFYTRSNEQADKKQWLIAYKIAEESDPLMEFLFDESTQKILQDKVLTGLFAQNEIVENEEEIILNYLKDKYFTGYYNKYNINLVSCHEEEFLNIKPGDFYVECDMYFDEIIANSSQKTSAEHLFLISDYIQQTYYLARLHIVDTAQNGNIIRRSLFLEFYNRFLPEGIGYPELLIDERIDQSKDISLYSFARYKDNGLVYKFGSFIYPNQADSNTMVEAGFYSSNQYRHLFYPVNEHLSIVVSRKSKNLIDIVAPFSYFLLFIGLVLMFILALIFHKNIDFRNWLNFRMRLQMLVIFSLIISYLFIAIISYNYIRSFYQQKNNEVLKEKSQSILIELEHKLSVSDFRDKGISPYLYQLLEKFSAVFFSDINLYDVNGRLLASSRPEIFEKGLISELMNREAYEQLKFQNAMYFIHHERVGSGKYLSSYIPFHDSDGAPVAFLNLPYFAKETELREEISSFMLTFLNIVFMLTGFSVWMALILSRRMTQPLMMIQKKMQFIGLGKPNEKIAYEQQDEIGQLVKQYNQLIDELEVSARMLAQSERENAWTEMARQVAHEIKNPLTPMRLSVQYLQKAWNDNDPELGDKLKNTTQTIVEQIDTLSEIASAFADFASMPAKKPENVSLYKVIHHAITLFDNDHRFKIVFLNQLDYSPIVLADQNSLIRVFNNLIKNAIQATEGLHQGTIQLTLSDESDFFIITIADNGKGMTDDQASRVFTPYFTTKTSGTGIGLSIVRNILQAIGGSISFKTEKGNGTTFTLKLPRITPIEEDLK
jgi:two-component system, NtrC family, nitrogen regulation sensor histidine kinase NtrY